MKIIFRLQLLFLAVLGHGSSIRDFITGNRIFTFDLYKELRKTETGNFFVSPFSAEVVLGLVQSGAGSKTGEEIRTSLHLPSSDEATKLALRSYFSTLNRYPHEEYHLHSANKIYIEKNLALRQSFNQVAASVYRAEVDNVDFSEKEEAVGTINEWVEKKTQNKIHDLIQSQNLHGGTVAVLINCLYFRARWLHEFNNQTTKKSQFYTSSTNVVKVDTMYSLEEIHNYYESAELGAKFLELPFRSSDASFIIVLPNEKDGLSTLETKPGVFTKKRYDRQLVNVALPKFKIESTVDLKKVLQKLGVGVLFSNEADLSGIAGDPGDLKVDGVLQKSFISVDEEGVEAAAATLEEFAGSALVRDPPKDFIVDHPFVFYIKVNSVVLFAGRVLDPTQ